MKMIKIQNSIKEIKVAFESAPFCNTYDIDDVIYYLEQNGPKPNTLNLKIFKTIVNYMEDNNDNLPSDLWVLKQITGSKKGWGYLTYRMIWQILKLQDLGWDRPKESMELINSIKNLKVVNYGNLRFIARNDLKKSFLNDMLINRKYSLAYYVKQMNDQSLSDQHKEYFGYNKNIQCIQTQIEELEKALQSVA